MLIVTATDLPTVMHCNGSRLMAASFPAEVNPFTQKARDEGDAAHYMALATFNGEFTIDELIDRKAPNGIYMTFEMMQHVQSFLSTLDCGKMEIETSFATDRWRVNSRADHIGYNVTTGVLSVDDLKYGWGLVEAERNWTLIAHAIGWCAANSITPTRIDLTIHQPRPHHIDGKRRVWSITYPQLMEFYQQIDATLSNPSDMLNTGVDICRKCKAFATCPAARKAEMNAIDACSIAFDDNISDELLAFEIDTLRTASATMKNRLEAIENLAAHRLKSGAVIDNFGLERSYGNRAWKKGITAPLIHAMTGKDLSIAKLPTPAEAERQGITPALLELWTERPQTGVKLVRMNTNKRAEKLLGN